MKTKEPPYTEPYVRWCERSANQLMVSLLLDIKKIKKVLDRGNLPLYNEEVCVGEQDFSVHIQDYSYDE